MEPVNSMDTPVMSRRLSAWLMVGALATITTFAAVRTFQLRQQLAEDSADRLRSALQDRLATWENNLGERAEAWLLELAQGTPAHEHELLQRQSTRWYEASYVWSLEADTVRFEHPALPVAEAGEQLLADPCMSRARLLSRAAPPEVAGLQFRRCRTRATPVRLLASSLSAAFLEAADQPELALEALDEIDPPLDFPLDRASQNGLSAYRMVVRRTQAARLLETLDQQERRERLLLLTATEISELSGGELESLLTTGAKLVRDDISSFATPGELENLDRRISRAHRRLRGWQEVRDRLSLHLEAPYPISVPEVDSLADSLRFASDIYGDRELLLAYAPIGHGRVAAIQLDGSTLLRHLSRDTGPDEARVAVMDSDGAMLYPDRSLGPNDIVLAEVPFERVFPQLRLALIGPTPADGPQGLGWLLGQLTPIALALCLGIIAILGRLAADRRQRELLTRQQAFIARVTHELKTPLAGIRVMAETLDMGVGEDPAQRRDFLERIIQEAQRLEIRIDDILKVARARRPGKRVSVDPLELAAEVVEYWRPRFELQGASLEADLAPCAELEADRALLRDAISNLLDNALKYRREDVPGRCLIRCLPDDAWTVFEVTDNGIGVPPAMRKTIFERFARIERPGRGKAGGHGLGLSFVAEAAAAHGGLIECREGFDGGARFILKLRNKR